MDPLFKIYPNWCFSVPHSYPSHSYPKIFKQRKKYLLSNSGVLKVGAGLLQHTTDDSNSQQVCGHHGITALYSPKARTQIRLSAPYKSKKTSSPLLQRSDIVRHHPMIT
jgi:hypothetical protein